jgi:fucose permease
VYWVGLALGRLSGVGLIQLLSPVRIIVSCLSGMLLSLLLLLLASAFRIHEAVWVFACSLGLCTSVLFPTGELRQLLLKLKNLLVCKRWL